MLISIHRYSKITYFKFMEDGIEYFKGIWSDNNDYKKILPTKEEKVILNRNKWKLNKNKHNNSYLQNAWNKYGSEIFNFIIIENCSIEDLNKRESYYVSILNKDLIYNLAAVKDAIPMSEELKRKKRENC